MSTFIIEIHPKKAAFDPLARSVKSELIEAGEKPASAEVETSRLFRIEGELTPQQAENAAQTLLVDPVVETATVIDSSVKKKPAAIKGVSVDVWLKPGVTDPVGETIEKGLKDLGLRGDLKASTATRYSFPKIKDAKIVRQVVKKNLANELIHDIRFR